jgi:hypothetical protein
LNAICRNEEGSGIKFINAVSEREIEFLTRLPEPAHYEIRIENDCESAVAGDDASDFRFYYDAITPADNLKYDFGQQPGAPSPRVCEGGYLSKTRTLGLTFRP